MKLYTYMKNLGQLTSDDLANEFCVAKEAADEYEAVFNEAVMCERGDDAVNAHAKMQDMLLNAEIVKVAIALHFKDYTSVSDLLESIKEYGSTWFTQEIEYLNECIESTKHEESRSRYMKELDEAHVGYWIAYDMEKNERTAR